MTTPTGDPIMLDRAHAEATLYRVAVCAFTHYPDKPVEEPGWTLEEDLAWCLAPLDDLPAPHLADFTGTIRTLITTPTADRQTFIRQLLALTGDDRPLDTP
ncbi:hypothetical protein [Microbacterium trichothecenolyticum]|uniref:Uncharacterized protein n=1 Tax=Microbacterium trichothecenolyticum TaxID=69370 RepID=A0A0M2HLJ7_MICTR|nr:hypothetical protein [Microbacterium trichothecenolyticum]KJL45773.1 hypothetical protein RS82_00053 [Microbacterium trichothecenolyticum]